MMKKRLQYSILIILTILISCKKERSCESCDTKNNQPPISIAGPNQVIALPTDSVLLNGSASSDPDGMISGYLWTKISGPASFTIIKPSDPITNVKMLVAGIYQFELKVKDNGGLVAKDTIQILVDAVLTTNHPPYASAGADQTITLPTNTIGLNASGSTDPDNNIAGYLWTKISGPTSFNIANANAVQSQVVNLVQGVYQFELKVTDAGGLFASDTMQVVVNPPSVSAACLPYNRPVINAQLTLFGTLSQARTGVAVASAGNKIVFAGGQISSGQPSAVVDIYNETTQTWSTAQLSSPRSAIAAIAAGTRIFFAGGKSLSIDTPSSTVDIYDVISNTWSTAQLSGPRSGISAAVVGNKVLFAGGQSLYNCSSCFSNKVDIYDMSSDTWNIANLSVARTGLSATSADNKVYFAGGTDWFVGTGVYDQIDIYDNGNNSWSASSLIERKADHASIVVGNYIYWAGGEIWNNFNDYETTCSVERRDLQTGTSTILHLFQPSFGNFWYQSGIKALLKNSSIVFYTGLFRFDIYDPSSGLWSVGKMNEEIENGGVIAVGNTIYIAGGGSYPYTPMSNKVFKLEF